MLNLNHPFLFNLVHSLVDTCNSNLNRYYFNTSPLVQFVEKIGKCLSGVLRFATDGTLLDLLSGSWYH